MRELTAIEAVREYFSSGPSGRPVTLPELKTLWKELSPDERREFGRQAAEAIGDVKIKETTK